MPDRIVVVHGLPGSGKTSIAGAIAASLSWPLVSKDNLKESAFDGGLSADKSGPFAIRRMYGVARAPGSFVLDSFFWHGVAEPDLLSLNKALLQIYCECPIDIARERYELRKRHLVHFVASPAWDTWQEYARPLAVPGPCLTVDTTERPNTSDVVAFISAHAISTGWPSHCDENKTQGENIPGS